MEKIDRRTFLRLGASTAVGVAIGSVINPIDSEINKLVSEVTGHPTGNAMIRQKMMEQEGSVDDSKKGSHPAPAQREIFVSDKVLGVIVNPPLEEIVFRWLPSTMVSLEEGSCSSIRDAFLGTGGIMMSKRELIVGAITSVGFGAAHNVIKSDNVVRMGFDRKNLPASQTFDGAVFWYLQRKFGFFANTFAHAWSNFLI